MDITKTVEKLIFEYFTKKAKEYSCSFSSLSILASISIKERTALFALYKDNQFIDWVDLKQLVDSDSLNTVTKWTAPSLIRGTFLKSLMRYESEFKTTARIAIYSNLDCFALENYTKRKQITINDIL